MTEKITRKTITDFSKENLEQLITGHIESFNKLKPGDLMSIYQFICLLACEEKSDIFTTFCPFLLANRENIEKNTGVQIKTPKETLEEIT